MDMEDAEKGKEKIRTTELVEWREFADPSSEDAGDSKDFSYLKGWVVATGDSPRIDGFNGSKISIDSRGTGLARRQPHLLRGCRHPLSRSATLEKPKKN
ncbi:hypothetical protein CRG98_023515 [Punica granatum]|uniref:Uncharacterized protein n=1 Tax=Punica granatum TaxID=22663 RepID=A0A2I0JJF1_PUNGR|nr:hypothetical protein CRG98_023515 [Punica granatum]